MPADDVPPAHEAVTSPTARALEPTDELVTTGHRLATTDGELAYTAITGRVVLGEEEITDDVFKGWKARAQVNVTAYHLDGADVTTRPITFVFNGGPGSPSIWLHMGLVGPRIVDLGEVDDLNPPPYRLMDNPHTLLRATDLVVIDALSTGYSRIAAGNKAKDWHGWSKDVELFSEFIRLWSTRYDRWMSPTFILGESYGTTRAVSVAQHLMDRYGLYVNALVLVSSVLDFGNQDFEATNWDNSAIHFLPSYAATAHYHGLHPGRTLAQVLAEAEEFATGRYRLALARGRRLPAGERAEVARTLASLTGLSIDYVERADLRIEHFRFCTELLREQGLAVGRIDSRFTGPLKSRTAEQMDSDPSGDATTGAFTAALHHYLRAELASTAEANYEIAANLWQDWSYKEFNGRPVDVTDKLERVMRANPHCRVRVEYGYYDLATPYYAAAQTMDHLHLGEQGFDRIEHAYFETGHMPYLHGPSRIREADEICAFIRASCPQG